MATSVQIKPGGRATMKPLTVIGVILIVIGIVALAYQGITYTTSEKVVDLGRLKVEAKREKTIPLPPVAGAAALVVGVILVVVGSRR
jgi:uncharacterized membrane protein YidH (DUF202 family)